MEPPAVTATPDLTTLRGTFPSQAIEALVAAGHITSEAGRVDPARIQPASLDLTLGDVAFQLPGSMLPRRDEAVDALIKQMARKRLDLSEPTLLDRGKVYLVRLAERVALPAAVAAYANNKSSTGRVDVQCRVVCDRNPRYDKIPAGHAGPLWLEIVPKSFDVIVQAGVSLNQAIFYRGRQLLDARATAALQADTPLLYSPSGRALQAPEMHIEEGVFMALDLEVPDGPVGWVARKTWEPLDLTRVAAHEATDFFSPLDAPGRAGRPRDHLWLERGRFYIFSTYEQVRVPTDYAVEMLPYDTTAGEFRAHYAGFFDPGFGYGTGGDEQGTTAVLEVRAYEDDLIVRHRQPICRMVYERLAAPPQRVYSAGIGSHYAAQTGPALSKFFVGG